MTVNTPPTVFDYSSIVRVVLEKKLLAITTIAIFLIAGFVISSVVQPKYQAEVQLLPPTEKEIEQLILGSIGITRSITPEIFDLNNVPEIFKSFKANLASRSHQYDFLKRFGATIFDSELNPKYIHGSADGFNAKVLGSDFAGLSIGWELHQQSSALSFLPYFLRNIFDPILTISVDSDRTTGRKDLVLSVTWTNSKIAANVANRYVEFISRQTVLEVIELVQSGLEMHRQSLADYIDHQREIALAIQQDDILKLQSAIKIAKELDIRKPTTLFGDYNSVQITPPASFFVAPNHKEPRQYPHGRPQYLPLYNIGNLNYQNQESMSEHHSPPLYSRGWQALELELDAIKQRTDIDSYIPNMRRLLVTYHWLDSRHINPDSIQPMRITEPATLPSSQVGWNRLKVMVAALLLGALGAIFLPLLVYLTSQIHKHE